MSSTVEYKCPNCGAPLIFDSSSQNLKCEYCSSEFSREQIEEFYRAEEERNNPQQEDFEWNGANNRQSNEYIQGAGYICTSCGAEIECDGNTVATECVYCGNPVILTPNVNGILRPDYVIPFKKSKDDAKQALKNFYKGKKLLPKVFKDENHIDKITGLYVPFWLFSCMAGGEAKFNATKRRSWQQGNYRYTETSHFLITRRGKAVFDKVPVDGSKKMEDDYMDSIEPFNYNDLVRYESTYLTGYFADKYDLSSEESQQRANNRIKNSLIEDFKNTINGYSSVTLSSSNIQTTNGKVDYAMLPVWILNTKYKGKTYTFAMNGQTGKMVGKLPIDKGIFCKWLFGLTGVFSAILSAIYLLANLL